ncbi:MAG: extracellular solute-binding protein [candidate division NC10 bacterium]|nr:extracellular solute-binding protein [candidate division NC10 bacterium]
MDERWALSRRQFLRTLAASGAVAASDLAWWEEPFLSPRKAYGASPVRFQFSVPEPKRTALVESLVERFNKSQSDVEVKVEFVPQAQARQKLITAITAGNPPDCCQVWDNWVGEFEGMGAVEDLTGRVRDWKHYKDTLPIAWQTVTVKGRILSFPWVVTNDSLYYRTDRLKEYGLKAPSEHWTWNDFLALAKGFTRADRNQYGFGMRGQGTWAVLYATEFMYGNGARVLKDGTVAINSNARLVPRPLPEAQGDPAERADRRLAPDRRGIRAGDHQHLPAQLRLCGGAEGVRGAPGLRHRPPAPRPGEAARLLLLLRDPHPVQGGQEQRRGLEVPDLPDG